MDTGDSITGKTSKDLPKIQLCTCVEENEPGSVSISFHWGLLSFIHPCVIKQMTVANKERAASPFFFQAGKM